MLSQGGQFGWRLTPSATPADDESEELFREETITKAEQIIEDQIAKLDGYELQDLVAGVLRAMGYRATRRACHRQAPIAASTSSRPPTASAFKSPGSSSR